MKKIIYIFLFFSSLSILSQRKVDKNVGDFSILKVYNGIELELIKSTEQKLEITGKKAEIEKIKKEKGT